MMVGVPTAVQTIPMNPKSQCKLYEPLILLKALNLEMRELADSSRLSDVDVELNARDRFETFVYKLALVCDSEKGEFGHTITSVVILQGPQKDSVEYRFASNQRTQEQLQETAQFVRDLLQKVRHLSSCLGQERKSKAAGIALLKHILIFNRKRVEYYLRALRDATLGAQKLDSNATGEGASTSRRFTSLREQLGFEWSPKTPESEYLERCQAVLCSLHEIMNSELGADIDQRARNARASRDNVTGCWPEFRHMANRLLAYQQAMGFFRRAEQSWPSLFKGAEVTFLPSSTPWPRPTRNNLNADIIVEHMTNRKDQIKMFQDFVKELQFYNLNERIGKECRKKTFRPIVHAEVLLLDDLAKQGTVSRDRFFGGWMYIGSSKPTCKLCHYYFEASRFGVRCRPTHGNLYLRWRFPDLLISQGEEGKKRRQIEMNRMFQIIRKETFELVRKRSPPTYRRHDSVTSTARITIEDHWSTVAGDDRISSRMREFKTEDI